MSVERNPRLRKTLRWSIVLFFLYFLLFGLDPVIDVRQAQATPDYKLPWKAGEEYGVTQGAYQLDATGRCVTGCSTHSSDKMRFAWDFDLPEKTVVVAARAGRVAYLQDKWEPNHCGSLSPIKDPPEGFVTSSNIGNEANYVVLDHGDGTSALYLHLSSVFDSLKAKARAGGRVEQGEPLGLSGKTGWTWCDPHIHFQVQDTGGSWYTQSRAIKFSDHDVLAKTKDGVPAEGGRYVSDNRLSAQPPSPKPPTKPSGPLPGSKGQSASRTKSVSDVDWRNTQYTADCQGLAAEPFTVDVHNGEGDGPPDNRYYNGYIVEVEAVTTGDLTGDGRPEAAVLLYCSPQPSNFFRQEVQVFTDGPQLLGELPQLSPLPENTALPPVFDSEQFFIRSGQLVTGTDYYSASDYHASGPSVHRVLTWQWDGSQFRAKPEQPSIPAASEKAGVEAAIRGHYEAIGTNNFVKAYSYFGPTFRNQVDRQSWVSSEESSQITGSTINSLKANNISGNQATATVDVSFQDKTGTSRFLITWQMVKEGGKWKLDKQVSGKRIS